MSQTMTETISLSTLEAIEQAMTPEMFDVHFCGSQERGRACGICTVGLDGSNSGGHADIFGSDSGHECSHPAALVNARGLVAARNALPALLTLAKASLYFETLQVEMSAEVDDARGIEFCNRSLGAMKRIRDALKAFRP